jgi:O-antigen/teichoic acid export membrane protein
LKEGILKIFRHSSVYFAADIASKAIGFILIPVYTIYLTPADYGTLNVVQLT